MKIFTCGQIKEIDAYTIEHEPVESVDLMDRAAGKLFSWIASHYSKSRHFIIFTGPGNNGGDGLALARMMVSSGFNAEVFHISISPKTSKDWNINRKRLEDIPAIRFNVIESAARMPVIEPGAVIIDAVFGSGLTRQADGLAAEAIKKINGYGAEIISIDVPSGLFCEDNSGNNDETIIHSDFTLSFQFPKLAFMFADNYRFTGEWVILDIGLHPGIISAAETPYSFITESDVLPILKKRHKFDHKGVFGHGLMISGSKGKMGAAILSSEAALRTGIGLLTCHVPGCGYMIMQTAIPEAMVLTDASEDKITALDEISRFGAIGIGPGIGTATETQSMMKGLLEKCSKPMVIDADGLNILSMNKDWLGLIPPGSVLTPHPKEFERIAGPSANGYKQLMRQIAFSGEHSCIVALKGAYTAVSLPDGRVFFNSTGNPGMATGGSGDVLTGMILSLLSQGYSPEDAAIIAVFLHGMAGDIAAEQDSCESVIASDIINSIGQAFKKIRTSKK
ncbi:MAG TPA: NAD(P)H-hydrate dehydratase [Bacteroidales bacterium]|nr:NAD(P)H-hydrate dehydratase [Bacteroidales bacterium]